MDTAMKFKSQYEKAENQIETDRAFSNAVESFEKLREASLNFLIKEILLDIDLTINKVGSAEWFDSNNVIVQNVQLTLRDYFRDYKFLNESNRFILKGLLQNAIAKSYISAILSKYVLFPHFYVVFFMKLNSFVFVRFRKMQLRGDAQRSFAKRCNAEAVALSEEIHKLPLLRDQRGKDPFEVVPQLMQFLTDTDLSMLYLEIMGMLKNYPDIRQEHFVALLSLREDMKTGAKRKVEESWPDKVPNSNNAKTIFSEIKIN